MGTRTKSYAKPFFFFWPVCSVNTVYSIHSSLVYFLCSIICCCSMSAAHATRTIKLRSALMSSQRIQDSNCTRSSLLIVPVLQFKWKCGCGVLEDCFQCWPGHRCQLRYIQVYYGLGKPCSRSHANDKTSREDKKDQDCRLHTGLGCNSSVLSCSIHQTACFPRVRSPDIYRSNTCSGVYWMYFVFVPWKELIELKNAQSRARPPDCYGRSLTYLTSVKRIMSGTFNKFIAASSGTTCSKLSINS